MILLIAYSLNVVIFNIKKFDRNPNPNPNFKRPLKHILGEWAVRLGGECKIKKHCSHIKILKSSRIEPKIVKSSEI